MPLPPRAAATMSLYPGRAFLRPSSLPDRYEIGGLIGTGTQGSVYSGMDLLTGESVAIKVLPTSDPGALNRVTREIAALRLLAIPGVVRLIDSGGDETDTWIVMERLYGTTFPAGRRSWDELRPLVAALLETLARVHDMGLLHRDIKPGNVIVDDAGQPVLLDFGLVRGAMAGPTITRIGAVMGTPLYMAPEQVRGDRADRRTDLYALGAMVREALTGEVPFHADQIGQIFDARLRQDPPTIRGELPDLPEGAVALLDALVARRPEARPSSARAALALMAGGRAAELLPWVGPTDPIDRLVGAARAGESAAVCGARGSGRTRALREAVAVLEGEGRVVRWIAGAEGPLASLRALLGEPLPDDEDPLSTMRARLEALEVDVVVADDWDAVDPWSRSLLSTSRHSVLASTLPVRSIPPVGGDVSSVPQVGVLRPFPLVALERLFLGPERLLHLQSDGGALLLRRTGGLASLVVGELRRWVDAGLAEVSAGRVRITRQALDHIAGGFAGPPLAEVVDGSIPPDLDDLLAWVHLASPGCTVERLASARNQPVWRVDLAVRQLEALGAVTRLSGLSRAGDAATRDVLEPLRPAAALASWTGDTRLAAHSALARTLLPGAEGRMVHLVAAGDGAGAVADAGALAERLVDDGRLADAVAAVQEAARVAVSSGVSGGTLWRTLAALAIQDGTGSVLATSLELLEQSDADPALREVVGAALAQVSGQGESIAGRLDGVHPDPGIQLLRWEVRIRRAAGGAPAEYEATVVAADAWARSIGTDAALAARAHWSSSWLYRQGRMREAAEEAERGTNIPQPAAGRMRLTMWAMSCLLLLAEVERAGALARQLLSFARARRLIQAEGHAEWMLRAIANQARTATGIDEELVEGARGLDAPGLAGLILVNEAVIGWWLGTPATRERGAELARLAESEFTRGGATASAVWARAVAIACQPDPAAANACAAEAVASGRPDIVLEVLGVLKLTGGLTGDWSAELASVLDGLQPAGFNSARRGALSPDEVVAAFAPAAPSGAAPPTESSASPAGG